jgi:hypothetical protein
LLKSFRSVIIWKKNHYGKSFSESPFQSEPIFGKIFQGIKNRNGKQISADISTASDILHNRCCTGCFF